MLILSLSLSLFSSPPPSDNGYLILVPCRLEHVWGVLSVLLRNASHPGGRCCSVPIQETLMRESVAKSVRCRPACLEASKESCEKCLPPFRDARIASIKQKGLLKSLYTNSLICRQPQA
ncbi:hypothetical protein QJS04_geneDACA011460 [Acorus gramineus]|uniref:Secreted protein n=1 Tax=Acorus gramineus TaxID=55184 RepID=A0AAV9AMR6_ACOGR|nr:hypothetical protein QJS04_geneDACA011460 [Acorus gramineus]